MEEVTSAALKCQYPNSIHITNNMTISQQHTLTILKSCELSQYLIKPVMDGINTSAIHIFRQTISYTTAVGDPSLSQRVTLFFSSCNVEFHAAIWDMVGYDNI